MNKIEATTPRPEGRPAAAGYALIRVCDTCGKVNAIDPDASEVHENEMQEAGHTVKRMSRDEAKEAWKTAGRCDHEALIIELRAQLATHNAPHQATASAEHG